MGSSSALTVLPSSKGRENRDSTVQPEGAGESEGDLGGGDGLTGFYRNVGLPGDGGLSGECGLREAGGESGGLEVCFEGRHGVGKL